MHEHTQRYQLSTPQLDTQSGQRCLLENLAYTPLKTQPLR